MLLNSTPENDIAARLRLWRKDVLEMTQVRFAEATGVHLSAIRKYEGRHSVPSGESLLAIAGTGVDLHWLLTGKGDMRAPSNKAIATFARTEADAELVRRLMAIEGLLNGIQDDKRSAVLEEIFSRVQEAKRVADLELLVGKLARKRA
jgi:transcriptional regulator with XRE-family HTH domain